MLLLRNNIPPVIFIALTFILIPRYGFSEEITAAVLEGRPGALSSGWSSLNESLEKNLSFVADKTPLLENIGGFVRNRHYLRFDPLGDTEPEKAINGKRVEDTYELRNDIRVDLDLQYKDMASGRVSVDTQLDHGVNRDDFHTTQKSLRLFEGYLDTHWKSLEARIGQQVIRWGKADEVNPIDNFTPEDYTEFINLDRADRKLPTLATYLKYYFSDVNHWEGIWIPFFNENRIAESEEDWEFFFRRNYRKRLGLVAQPEQRPGKQFKNSVWATRMVHQGSFMDASLSYAYHFEQNPSYKITLNPLFPALSPFPGTIDTVWKRQHSIGADFEIPRGDFGARGEMVFTTNKPYITNDITDEDLIEYKNVFQTVTGFDYTYRSHYYINLQLTQDFILEHEDAMEPRGYEPSVTFRLQRKFLHEKLKFQLMGRYYFSDVDFYYKANVIYELLEDLEVDFGAFFFEGKEQDLFGQFDKNDQLYLNLKYSF